MKVTVVQLDAGRLDQEWDLLVEHTHNGEPDLVLLPEMPFCPWLAASSEVQPERWDGAARRHEEWLRRLPELRTQVVAGTVPVTRDEGRFNAAFVWTVATGVQFVHRKTYLPDEPGFWEASWYRRGPVDFRPLELDGLTFGFLICTELWFLQHAREYSRQGVDLLLCPRSTPSETTDKWLAGGRVAAVVSGAFCLSSNHAGVAQGTDLGGVGWVADPDGNLLGTTSSETPFLTLEIDLGLAAEAKMTYPRYVDDG